MIRSLIRSRDHNFDLKIDLGARHWRSEASIDGVAPRRERVRSVLAIAALILAQIIHPPHDKAGHDTERQRASAQLWHDPYVKVFRGPHVPRKLSELAVRDPLRWRKTAARIGAVTTGTKIVDLLAGALTLEWEALYADHWGMGEFGELGTAIYARWNRFPWNRYIRTTFAVGMGPSITTKPAPYEPKGGTRSRWLMQLNFEINVYSPSKPQWALLFRIQHRSGMYQLINEVRGGSNFLTIGLRKNFAG